MTTMRNLVGEKFGLLTVVELVGKNKHGHLLWHCKCDCGNNGISSGEQIKSGIKKSCGCLKKTQQGLSRDKSSLYSTWRGMMRRCYEKTNSAYKRYGGRGICVEDSWHDFKKFNADMFPLYEHGLTLERLDNDGNYSKDNCVWATMRQQSNNRRSSVKYHFDGETLTLPEWARKLDMNIQTLQCRVYRYGWDIVTALTTPVQKKSYE